MPVPPIRVATINDVDGLLGLMEKLIVKDYEEGRHFDRKKAPQGNVRLAFGQLAWAGSFGN